MGARFRLAAGRTERYPSIVVGVQLIHDKVPRLRGGGYPWPVAYMPVLEDERGVDVARILDLLRLTPAERVAHMVQVVNTLRAIASHAQAARR